MTKWNFTSRFSFYYSHTKGEIERGIQKVKSGHTFEVKQGFHPENDFGFKYLIYLIEVILF